MFLVHEAETVCAMPYVTSRLRDFGGAVADLAAHFTRFYVALEVDTARQHGRAIFPPSTQVICPCLSDRPPPFSH